MGFLIDAVVRRRWVVRSVGDRNHNNLAEIIIRMIDDMVRQAALLLVVWTLKREVRAFGGCLGMYRR